MKKLKTDELAHVPNSRSKEKVEHEKALKALDEAAEYLELSVNAFNMRKKKHRISYEIKGGKHVFKKYTLDKYLEKHPKNT